ncbi:MAG TPA: hypothetical protein VFQ90_14680 [Stellaceae bacterium]|nr:hypothetical protein [Stellaceae bacterium]
MREAKVCIKHFTERVAKVLLTEWDPIGIKDVPSVRNEYNSYVAGIVNIILSNRSESELAEHLVELETNEMGLRGERDRAERVARILFGVKRKLASAQTDGL